MQLRMLKSMIPSLDKVAMVMNGNNANDAAQVEQVRSEAHGLGLEVVTLDIRKPDDIGPAFDQAAGVQDCRQIIVCICEAAHSVPMLVVAK